MVVLGEVGGVAGERGGRGGGVVELVRQLFYVLESERGSAASHKVLSALGTRDAGVELPAVLRLHLRLLLRRRFRFSVLSLSVRQSWIHLGGFNHRLRLQMPNLILGIQFGQLLCFLSSVRILKCIIDSEFWLLLILLFFTRIASSLAVLLVGEGQVALGVLHPFPHLLLAFHIEVQPELV